MRIVTTGLLTAALLSASSALACEGDTEAKVVGWKDDGSIVVRTLDSWPTGEEDESRLWLATYVPESSKPAQKWVIQEPGDSQAVRGANWKAAEAELVAQGFTIVPDAPIAKLTEIDLGTKALLTTITTPSCEGVSRVHLVASMGERSLLLQPAIGGCCWGGNAASSAGPWRVPGGRWLVHLGVGCGGSGSVMWHDLMDIQIRLNNP